MRTHMVRGGGSSALRRLVVTLTATLVALAGLAVPATVVAAPAHAGSGARHVSADFDAQVVYWTNVVRKRNGLKPLKPRTCIERFAYRHTKRLAARDAFHHQALRPVLHKCGMRTVGENIAYRSPSMTGRQAVRMWRLSPGHRANMLAKKYKYIGVDAFRSSRTGRIYAGQVFGG